MRSIPIILIFFIPLSLSAQLYTFDYNKIANYTDEDGLSINLSEEGWTADAKIIFTNVKAADKDKLKIMYQTATDAQLLKKGVHDPQDDKLTFFLEEIIKNNLKPDQKTIVFDVYESDQKKFSVTFDLMGNLSKQTGTNSGDSADDNSDETMETYMNAFAGANVIGDNGFLSNLTPVVNLGGITTLIGEYRNIKTAEGVVIKKKSSFTWELDINPYIGSVIKTADSNAYLPALMLYGRAGISINNYFTAKLGEQVKISIMPFGFGLKAIPEFQDSVTTLIQHNIRFGLGFSISNALLITGQITQGWHNFSSRSEQNYEKTFGKTATDITYITVNGQFGLRGKSDEVTNYVFIEWRNLMNKNHYEGFTNTRFYTVGIRKTFSLSSSNAYLVSSKSGEKKPRAKKLRPML
jgi:hypothetical protein